MELARSTTQQDYIKQVKALEAIIEEATQDKLDLNALDDAQKQLDVLAKKYQHDKKIGLAAYKLYELQAAIYYFSGNGSAALDFIDQAIETRGHSYTSAEKLKAQLLEESRPNQASGHVPLELDALTKSLHTSAFIMVFVSILSVYFIPWAIFYIVLATKLNPKKVPSRGLVKAAAIVTLPLCLALIPILIDIEFWRMNKRLKDYEERGAQAFMSDRQWLEGEPKRKRGRDIALWILIAIIVIFALLIFIAALSGRG